MGERHQLFVIARVGKHYRCLAVVHHQFLCGWFALAACVRLLTIFSDKSNRLPLEMELHLAADYYKNQGPPKRAEAFNFHKGPKAEPVRFPFIATCLILGTSTDSDNCTANIVHLEPQDLGFDQGDNNTGITVLDITDLDNVRYCFLAWHRVGWRYSNDDGEDDDEVGQASVDEDDIPAELNKPWRGSEYMRHYIDKNHDWKSGYENTRYGKLMSKLDEVPLVHPSALAGMFDVRLLLLRFTSTNRYLEDVWPWGDWTVDQPLEADATPKVGAASLQDMAMAKLLQTMLSIPKPDLGLLDEARNMPTFRKSLMEHLYAANKDVVSAPGAPELLREAFAGQSFLDWTRFSGLTPETITAAFQGPELKDARGLALCPNWETTTTLDLAESICTLPRLLDLYIMERPERNKEGPIGEFYKALAANPRCPSRSIMLSGAASYGLNQQRWLPTAEPFTPPSSFPVIQLVVHHDDHQRWREEPEFFYYYLGDGFLTPAQFVDGLMQLLANNVDSPMVREWNTSAAHCFSYNGLTFDRDTNTASITPLLAETYTASKKAYHSSAYSGCFTKMRDLVPGTWTVVVRFGELFRTERFQCFNHFECAFIRPRDGTIKADPYNPTSFGPDDLEVLDLKGFLQATVPDADMLRVERQLNRLEKRARYLLSLENGAIQSPTGPLFSHTPMDSQTASNLLKKAIDNLSEVHKRYRQSIPWLRVYGEEEWYPELGLEIPSESHPGGEE